MATESRGDHERSPACAWSKQHVAMDSANAERTRMSLRHFSTNQIPFNEADQGAAESKIAEQFRLRIKLILRSCTGAEPAPVRLHDDTQDEYRR
jgi:hypothetical protein